MVVPVPKPTQVLESRFVFIVRVVGMLIFWHLGSLPTCDFVAGWQVFPERQRSQRVLANRDRTFGRLIFLRLVDLHLADDSSLQARLTSDAVQLTVSHGGRRPYHSAGHGSLCGPLVGGHAERFIHGCSAFRVAHVPPPFHIQLPHPPPPAT